MFSDAAALERLNAITHRHISCRVDDMLRSWAMEGGAVAAIDAVALYESGMAERCSAVIGVTADREKRIERIMARDGISREYAEKRIDAQPSDEYYRSVCTKMLVNDSGEKQFKKQCEALFMEVLK